MSIRNRKLTESIFELRIDAVSYFSFHLAKSEIRLDNDGQIFFNIGTHRIRCGDGPLFYGIEGVRSGIVDVMIVALNCLLSSTPIKEDLIGNIGKYYYNNHIEDENIFQLVQKYMVTTGSDALFWVYRITEEDFFFEFTTGSHFNDPETPFVKVHSGKLKRINVETLIEELTHFRTNFKEYCKM